MKIPLNLCFKGQRHYIHGSDFFNAVESSVRLIDDGGALYVRRLEFRRFAYNLTDLCIGEDVSLEHCVGEGDLMHFDGRRQPFWLSETDRTPLCRHPFDEDAMVKYATFMGRSASLRAPIQYTSIEAIIALTKTLNYRLTKPNHGKWLFGKIELKQAMPAIGESLSITCTKGVPGRFSINEIMIDGHDVGVIHFIVGSP
jgi:hypothetical protein